MGFQNSVAQAALALSAGFFVACGDQNPTITSPHRIRQGVDAPRLNATEGQRFGMRGAEGQGDQGSASPQASSPADLFEWTTPEGWQAQASSQYRWINMKVGQVECYLSQVVQGGTKGNIDRWCDQMGVGQLDGAAIAALPRTSLLGKEAVRVDLAGSYTGMTGNSFDDARMFAAIADLPDLDIAITVKMIGPSAEVTAQEANFDTFVTSVQFTQAVLDSLSAASAQDENAGQNHAPGEGHWAWDVPEGWKQEAARQMRYATFSMPGVPDVECYITLLPGNAGSEMENINRWLKQVGLPVLDAAGVDALPRISLLGEQAGLLEGIGASSAVLATQIQLTQEVMFVKMFGPPAGVSAQKANFLAFCNSLRNE